MVGGWVGKGTSVALLRCEVIGTNCTDCNHLCTQPYMYSDTLRHMRTHTNCEVFYSVLQHSGLVQHYLENGKSGLVATD